MKKIELLHFTVAKKNDHCSTVSSSCHFFCHLLESGLARINWIRANVKICVEQLISCQKCRAISCRAIAIRAVHPHSWFAVKSCSIEKKQIVFWTTWTLTKSLKVQELYTTSTCLNIERILKINFVKKATHVFYLNHFQALFSYLMISQNSFEILNKPSYRISK